MAQKAILVVDDEPEILQIYSAKLRGAGFDVLTAENGEEGVKLAKSKHPDLILMDLKMPVMNGVEAISKIKEDPQTRDIKVAFLTAFSDPLMGALDLKLAKDIGAVDYIKKGLDLNELVERINKYFK